MMEPGTLIGLTATNLADRRTKTRLSRSDVWVFNKESTECMLFGATPIHAILVASHDDIWFGWFPLNHVAIKRSKIEK